MNSDNWTTLFLSPFVFQLVTLIFLASKLSEEFSTCRYFGHFSITVL